MSAERLHATVRGMVQGVGFRHFVIREAQALGLAGTVANRRDGSVEVVAEGQRDGLERLLAALHEGPLSSVVKDVRTEWGEAAGTFVGFDVTF